MNLKEYNKIPAVSGLYQIINIVNNKMYIGSAVNLRRRIHKHYYELNKGVHVNEHLLRAFVKYGIENFEINFFTMAISHKELLEREKQAIIKYNVLQQGYNLMLDNSSYLTKLNKSSKHINDNIAISAKAVYGFDRFTGDLIYNCKSISDAARLVNTSSSNISRCCKHKLRFIKNTVWIYQKDYEPTKTYICATYVNKGVLFTEERRAKLIQRLVKERGIPVYVYDENLQLVSEHLSIREGELSYGINKDMLRYRLNTNKLHSGYYWKTNKL
jgi:predicted GIY-YIG superfamily endonuclease